MIQFHFKRKEGKTLLVGIIISVFTTLLILRKCLFLPGFIPNAESLGGYPFLSQHVRVLWDPLFKSGNRIELALIRILCSLLDARNSYFFVLLFMGTIAFFVTTKFTEDIVGGFNQYLVGSLATVAYMVNQITAHEIFRIGFIWNMSWVPLLFYLAFTYFGKVNDCSNREITKKSIYLAIIISLIVGPVGTIPHDMDGKVLKDIF